MGLLVHRDFLSKFNDVEEDEVENLAAGRVVRLPLRGPQGALDLYVVYMPTGPNTSCERIQVMRTIAEHMQPQSKVLSLVLGDFNFATQLRDRWNKVQGQWSGDTDKIVQKEFEKSSAYPSTSTKYINLHSRATRQERARVSIGSIVIIMFAINWIGTTVATSCFGLNSHSTDLYLSAEFRQGERERKQRFQQARPITQTGNDGSNLDTTKTWRPIPSTTTRLGGRSS